MISVMVTVPQIAGKTPPALLASRGSSARNSPHREAYTPSRPASPSRLGCQARTIPSSGTLTTPPEPVSNSTAQPAFSARRDAVRSSSRFVSSATASCTRISASAARRSSARRSRCDEAWRSAPSTVAMSSSTLKGLAT